MTLPPPPPPQYQPPGPPPGYHSGGFPPPPQFPGPPFPGPYAIPPVPQSTSLAAVFSLVCGIAGCLLITPIVAILAGIAGVSATRRPTVRGRGMAITGIILGIVWLGIYALVGVVVSSYLNATKPQRALADQFMYDLSSGNLVAAQAQCTDKITPDELKTAASVLKGYGAPKNIWAFPTAANTMGITEGVVVFSSGNTRRFDIVTIDDNGTLKVDRFTLSSP